MKKDWEVKKLGEVCEYDKIQDTHKNLPYVGLEHIESNTGTFLGSLEPQEVKSSTFYFTEEHVLYGRLRPYLNKVLLPKFKGHCSTEIFPIKVKRDIIKEFLFYWLISETTVKKINATWTGARMPRANMNQVLEFDFAFPSLPEQQRIVSILDKCFTAINKVKSNTEQNLKNTKELFKSYLQGVFEKKDKNWEIKKLGDVCDLKSGTTISTSLERAEGDVLYVKVGDMTMQKNDVEINTSSRYVNRNEIDKNQIIPNGAVIFPKRGGAIATNKKRKIIKPTIVDLNIMAIIPKEKIDNNYFYYWFQLIDLNNLSNGTSIPQINNYSFDQVYIPFPPLKDQQSIVRQLDSLKAQTQKLETVYNKKIADLEELKSSILQKAFRGQL